MDAFKHNVLTGKTAFIVGASSDINLGIAQNFAQQGTKMVSVNRTEEKIAAASAGIVKAGGDALGIAADARDFAALDAAFTQARDRFGKIHIVLSGAASNFVAAAAAMSANAFNVLRASYLNRAGASLLSITPT